MMDTKQILQRVDHTLLSQTATWAQIQTLCEEGAQYGCASVCIPASYVSQAKIFLADRLPICTVIGFPNGYNTTTVKCTEAADAVANGADEIDMVINLGWAKDARYLDILHEIQQIKAACGGKLLKVIVEACLLTREEKIELCHVVSDSGADFIKTSTGFSTSGATFEDVKLFRQHAAPHVKVKAAGGISSLADAEQFILLGADRLGTSRIVKAVKAMETQDRSERSL